MKSNLKGKSGPTDASNVRRPLTNKARSVAMSANEILPDSPFSAQRIIESAGAQFCGSMAYPPRGTLVYFRDPVTGTSLALWERDLSAAAVQTRMENSRATFGAKVQS